MASPTYSLLKSYVLRKENLRNWCPAVYKCLNLLIMVCIYSLPRLDFILICASTKNMDLHVRQFCTCVSGCSISNWFMDTFLITSNQIYYYAYVLLILFCFYCKVPAMVVKIMEVVSISSTRRIRVHTLVVMRGLQFMHLGDLNYLPWHTLQTTRMKYVYFLLRQHLTFVFHICLFIADCMAFTAASR